MHKGRHRLLSAQAQKGIKHGGTCPECGSNHTICINEVYCEECGEPKYDECLCYDCKASYTVDYECYCTCPNCGEPLVTDNGGWQYCPNCGYNS